MFVAALWAITIALVCYTYMQGLCLLSSDITISSTILHARKTKGTRFVYLSARWSRESHGYPLEDLLLNAVHGARRLYPFGSCRLMYV